MQQTFSYALFYSLFDLFGFNGVCVFVSLRVQFLQFVHLFALCLLCSARLLIYYYICFRLLVISNAFLSTRFSHEFSCFFYLSRLCSPFYAPRNSITAHVSSMHSTTHNARAHTQQAHERTRSNCSR